jgi:outer membrane phospholipase A
MRSRTTARLRKFVATGLVLVASATSFAETVSTLIAPRDPVPAGGVVVVEWMVVNPTTSEATANVPATADGLILGHGTSTPVQLRAASDSSRLIAPGGFVLRRFEFQLPSGTTGKLVLEVSQPGASPLRTALDVRSGSSEPAEKDETRLSSLAASSAAAPTIVRTFAGRLSPHEPIYFIYGSENPAAKFQFSFKYRLLTLSDGSDEFSPATLQFGFTQRSLWDIDTESSPFYDTSYIPEVMFEALTPAKKDDGGWFSFLGYQLGYRHESNGRAGDVSRSLNNLYARGIWAIGPLDRWHLLVIPEFWGYIGDLSNNPQIKDYRGIGQLRLVLGTNDGPSLMATAWAGEEFDHRSYQLDLTVPVRTRLLDFETYFIVQYFHGYGESLLSYQSFSETIRAGLSFVR